MFLKNDGAKLHFARMNSEARWCGETKNLNGKGSGEGRISGILPGRIFCRCACVQTTFEHSAVNATFAALLRSYRINQPGTQLKLVNIFGGSGQELNSVFGFNSCPDPPKNCSRLA